LKTIKGGIHDGQLAATGRRSYAALRA